MFYTLRFFRSITTSTYTATLSKTISVVGTDKYLNSTKFNKSNANCSDKMKANALCIDIHAAILR